MKNNRIIQDAIGGNSNADIATNKNYNRSINEHQHEHFSQLTSKIDLINPFM